MANLFSRIKNTVLADLHEALDHKGTKKSNCSSEPIFTRM